MGKALSKLFGKKDMRILMLGLDAAGKTSILVVLPREMTISFLLYNLWFAISISLLASRTVEGGP